MIDRSELGAHFLKDQGWGSAEREFLQGDASSRKYEILHMDAKRALFVDSPEKPDVPPAGHDKTYAETAHIAKSVVPFVALAHYLKHIGFTVPDILASDLEHGFMLVEDLGRDVYGAKIARGDDMDTPYIEAVNVLLHLAKQPACQDITGPDGTTYHIPGFDEDAFLIEAELLTNWFWKWLGVELPESAVLSFRSLWREYFARLGESKEPSVLALRDYHSPNIIWCADKKGMKRAGLIDFQDAVFTHPAYDLVSLLQDARTDIPAEVEEEYKTLYLKERTKANDAFDQGQFDFAYAILGAQRNTKILGVFVRLALRDDKPHYLAHIPRVLGYLERCLLTPGLEGLKAWYETYLPEELRKEISAGLSKSDIGRNAIVLSAGLGKRMAPLSNTCPKPLIKVCDKPLLEYSIEKLSNIHVQNIVVNVHYLADQIERYIAEEWQGEEEMSNLIISDERAELLETGGGIKKALPLLGTSPFFVLNSDSIWLEENQNNLARLIEFWDDEEMDCLILLAEKDHALGFSGRGDFELGDDGRIQRRTSETAPFVVSGTYLVHPRLFETSPEGPFSMNVLWNKALDEERLFGLKLEGTWLHIGTPEAVEDAEKYISEQKSGLS